MKNIVVCFAIALVLALAISYIIYQKKKGNKCIGCPYAKDCGKHGCCAKENKQSED